MCDPCSIKWSQCCQPARSATLAQPASQSLTRALALDLEFRCHATHQPKPSHASNDTGCGCPSPSRQPAVAHHAPTKHANHLANCSPPATCLSNSDCPLALACLPLPTANAAVGAALSAL
ncbi:hypothetical protein BCR44DRAFT_294852 [Catenaria anguillulae PL171]|uniref:Uncharacterized protein n=1 Tax=Catenaria anguillulae PL171 TaxID=765915 RepID=A0A1Y2HPF5_9FUNG|nr:hypothetical protein BCR44DRAFT_294852 [Catenaria anguillulae PL171]